MILKTSEIYVFIGFLITRRTEGKSHKDSSPYIQISCTVIRFQYVHRALILGYIVRGMYNFDLRLVIIAAGNHCGSNFPWEGGVIYAQYTDNGNEYAL